MRASSRTRVRNCSIVSVPTDTEQSIVKLEGKTKTGAGNPLLDAAILTPSSEKREIGEGATWALTIMVSSLWRLPLPGHLGLDTGFYPLRHLHPIGTIRNPPYLVLLLLGRFRSLLRFHFCFCFLILLSVFPHAPPPIH